MASSRMFVGREAEVAEFIALIGKKTASLVTCQGRRRVGKSAFIEQCAAHADHFLSFTGLPPRAGIDKRAQLDAFALDLAAQTNAPKVKLEGWAQAFQLLASQISATGATVLSLDEISWMAVGDPDFAGHLKNAWDRHFSNKPKLVLVLCGSVSSWIEQNILQGTGFVGRCSWQFRLKPLALPYCSAFWRSKSGKVSTAQKLSVLAVTGGIPRYLEEIDPRQSAEQNIQRLCFQRGGMLFNEFDQIFHDIFSRRAETYREVVRTLVDGPKRIQQISKNLGRARGGSLSEALHDLELAGFVAKDVSFDAKTGKEQPRSLRYRLSDNYVRFYLKYVEPVRSQVERGLFERVPLESMKAWPTMMGLQFENLVLNSVPTLTKAAGLGNVPIINAGPHFQSKTQRRAGCQVDLLVRTKQAVYVFEVKFRSRIEKTVIDEVRRKVDSLKLGPSITVRTGLVYEGDLHPEIEHADYFDVLIPAKTLLEPSPRG